MIGSMEVKLSVIEGKYDRQDQATDRGGTGS